MALCVNSPGSAAGAEKEAKAEAATTGLRAQEDSNATKATKQMKEFLAKVEGLKGQGRATSTALSGSFLDEDEEAQRGASLLSHHRENKSKKSVASQGRLSSTDSRDQLPETGTRSPQEEPRQPHLAKYQSVATPAGYNDASLMMAATNDALSFNRNNTIDNRQLLAGANTRHKNLVKADVEFVTKGYKSLFDNKGLGKKDLVPPNNQYHRVTSLNEFMSNRFDFYAREYGEFFQLEITKFE